MLQILLSVTLALGIAGFSVALVALLLSLFVRRSPGKRSSLRQLGWSERCVFFLAGGAGISLGVAFVCLIVAGIGWCVTALVETTTPAGLALMSILVGFSPMLLTISGLILARLSGGKVNAAGAENCYLLGLNLNKLVHAFFMSYWWIIFTGGIAIFGLIGSGVWTLFN